MTHAVVAQRSGVSRSTVERVLSGHYGSASFDTVQAIAEAVGATVSIEDAVNTDDMLESQAKLKAEAILNLVQGTSALEGQGLTQAAAQSMIRQAVHRLLAGSKRTLWTS